MSPIDALPGGSVVSLAIGCIVTGGGLLIIILAILEIAKKLWP